MNKELLNTDCQEFIKNNLSTDLSALILSKKTIWPADSKEIIQQIESKSKAENKLPTWFNTDNIYYPPKTNIEQTSSEIAAKYKSDIINGDLLFDVTAGFGVDDYYFSKKYKTVIGCELNSELAKITEYNLKILGASNIKIINTNGIDYLKDCHQNIDLVYIDPSRRHNVKGKIFRFEDSEPNILNHLELFFSKTEYVMVKSSPLVDLSLGIGQLKNVFEIHVLSISNDVKELVWILKKGYKDKITIKTVNILDEVDQRFSFIWGDENESITKESLPSNYLYEPNSAILKSGAFKLVGRQFNLNKLNKHSHLYTSDEHIEFPGRSFKIEKNLRYSKKSIKQQLPNKANFTVRNFPKTVSQLRQEFKVEDGGHEYIFFTTDLNDEKIVLFCKKI